MTKVTLHGQLAEKFGAEWEFLIHQPREAVAALQANTGGAFYEYLRQRGEETNNAVQYRFLVNGQDHKRLDELWMVGEINTIDIIPVMAGAGGGLWQTILGVVLIVVGVVVAVAAGWTGVGLQVGVMIGLAGLSMVVGGVAAMMAPSPTFNPSTGRTFRPMTETMGGEEEDGSGKQASYLFSGAANTTQQGNPVPIIYGEMVAGSHLISVGLSTSFVPVDGAEKDDEAAPGWTQESVWTTLEGQVGRRDLVRYPHQYRALGLLQLQVHIAAFHITGKATVQELRYMMNTLHFLFHGPREAITKANAKFLWQRLPGPPALGVPTIHAKAKDYALAIATYYATNPNPL